MFQCLVDTTGMDRLCFIVQGERYTREDIARRYDCWQAALARAHQVRHHPMCMCKPSGVPMVVAKREDFFVRRFPSRGADHAPDCRSHELVSELAELQADKPSTTLSYQAHRYVTSAVDRVRRDYRKPDPTPAAVKTSTLREILSALWHRAGLCRYAPDRARCGWARHRSALRFASHQLQLSDAELSPRLALTGEAQLRDFLRQMEQQQSAAREIRFICGPLEMTKLTANDAVLRFRGEQTAFWSQDKSCVNAAQAAFDLATTMARAEVYALIAVYWDRNFRVHDTAFVAVADEGVPIISNLHAALYGQLIERQIPFFLPKGAMIEPENYPLLSLPKTDKGPLSVVSDADAPHASKAFYPPFVWSIGQPLPV
ncbi:MAG: DUF1173 family protein [Rhodocyclaceae bacterium]|jgi:hypothetical protein|nr:DUF1173 family protein [Rhodocyclaceae bacterium]MCA3039187.1 DUF1173 family protein [Rhodocyclaceae bacterium]MCA3042038.1 DUF1173 family protein [Rhodocyclaceae bacterium]MCA3056055.1 DUF1173 family protein [Rhodocyclaceae bacterium]MCA3067501.1 DUF1173 family protein [Rhodocyclaceae bacterium]